MLRMCLNSMLFHGHIPKQLRNTILVSIAKDKKDINDIENYRPKAVTSVSDSSLLKEENY